MRVSFINPKLQEYLYSFDKATLSKIVKLTDLLEMFGEKIGMPYSKHISHNLYELRIRGNREVRILYCFYNQNAVLVHAFVKKPQKTPQKEINIAVSRIKLLTAR